MGLEDFKKRREELVQKMEKIGTTLGDHDDAVNAKMTELRQLRRDLQTAVEHNSMDSSESEKRVAEARNHLVDMRLLRLEDGLIALAELSSTSSLLLTELMGLLAG